MQVENNFQASKKHSDYVNEASCLGGSLSSKAALLNSLHNYLSSTHFLREATFLLNCDEESYTETGKHFIKLCNLESYHETELYLWLHRAVGRGRKPGPIPSLNVLGTEVNLAEPRLFADERDLKPRSPKVGSQ